jgi:predicted MPP superfamily phosphohydrolase
LQQLAARLGAEEFEMRLAAEQRLCEKRGKRKGKGIIALEDWIDFYGLVRFGLKLSGLWQRAVRNYFDIKVEHHTVPLSRLPEEFDGFRILHITDLHADLHPDFPAAVRRVIGTIDCDLVAVTGDFRTCSFGDPNGATQATIEILKDLSVPIYATLGNHDFVVKVVAMEAAGVRFLLNENITVARGDARLHLVGIDDPNYYKTHNFKRALGDLPEDECKVLLSHSPETYREAAAYGFDFQISGHTHGGQLCLPGGRVIVHDHSAPRRLLAGAWQHGSLQGYTSRGTGASGLPVRLNCPAEVTVHTLRAL